MNSIHKQIFFPGDRTHFFSLFCHSIEPFKFNWTYFLVGYRFIRQLFFWPIVESHQIFSTLNHIPRDPVTTLTITIIIVGGVVVNNNNNGTNFPNPRQKKNKSFNRPKFFSLWLYVIFSSDRFFMVKYLPWNVKWIRWGQWFFGNEPKKPKNHKKQHLSQAFPRQITFNIPCRVKDFNDVCSRRRNGRMFVWNFGCARSNRTHNWIGESARARAFVVYCVYVRESVCINKRISGSNSRDPFCT